MTEQEIRLFEKHTIALSKLSSRIDLLIDMLFPREPDYEGYDEWIKENCQEPFPEYYPEPNQSEVSEHQLLTLGHY